MSFLVNDKTVSLIKKYEGFKGNSYICPGGKKTIGYGHVILLREEIKNTMSETKALELLEKDLNDTYKRIKVLFARIKLNENQLGALVSLAFNIGVYKLSNSKLARFVLEGNFQDAAKEFNSFNKVRDKWGNLKVLAGLVARRAEERKLFEEKTA